MFRTARNLLLSGTTLAMLAAGARAAEPAGEDADLSSMLQNLRETIQAKSGPDAAPLTQNAADAVRTAILNAILDIATREEPTPAITPDSDITIDEIDALNRNAERAKTKLELEKTELVRKETQLQGLLTLYQTLEVISDAGIDGAPESRDSEILDRIDTLMAVVSHRSGGLGEDGTPGLADPASAVRSSLPRVLEIFGVAGNLEARVQFQDGSIAFLPKGATIQPDLRVEDITIDRVTLESLESGKTYHLSPRNRVTPRVAPAEDETITTIIQ